MIGDLGYKLGRVGLGVLLLAMGTVAQHPWPMFRGDIRHTSKWLCEKVSSPVAEQRYRLAPYGLPLESSSSLFNFNISQADVSRLTSLEGKKRAYHLLLSHCSASQLIKTTEENTPSVWEKVGIYGLEFLGAGVGATGSVFVGILFVHPPGGGMGFADAHWARGFCAYTLGNLLFPSTAVWATGKLLGQEGSWERAAVLAAMGGVVAVPLCASHPILLMVLPALGAVIGYNS